MTNAEFENVTHQITKDPLSNNVNVTKTTTKSASNNVNVNIKRYS